MHSAYHIRSRSNAGQERDGIPATVAHAHRPCAWICWIALATVGCSDAHTHHASKEQAALSRMLFSPNGEPLNGGPLGRPTCQDALSRWFARADTNHDGALSRQEFLADAQAQFRRMDIDHNGYLVSEEVERYRRPYRQQAASEESSSQQSDDSNQPQESGRHGGKRHGGSGGGENRTQDNTPAGDTSDPVMSADTNLDFKVTPEEFMAHAEKVFTGLDINHNNTLSRDEALARCNVK